MNFLCVCQSVSWPVSLLKLVKYRDISSSGWDIFLKFFGDISGMLVHYFQIILNFLYVSQSVYLLASILKLDKCRDIYSSRWDIFLKFFGDIPGMLVHYFRIILNFLHVSQSLCLLTSLPNLDKGISPVPDEISFWNFLETFLRCLYTFFKFLQISCMSVSLLVGLNFY